MKLNWGTGIAATLAVFVGMMAWFAMRAINNPESLVAEDYYQRELHFQGEIDKLDRSRSSGEYVQVDQSTGSIVLQFPHTTGKGPITGRLQLMRPSDARGDRMVDVHPDSAGRFEFDTHDLLKGAYRLRLDWTRDGEERLHEQPIDVE